MQRRGARWAAVAGVATAALVAGCDVAPSPSAEAPRDHVAPTVSAPAETSPAAPATPAAKPQPSSTATAAVKATKPPKKTVKHSAALDKLVAATRPSLKDLMKSSGNLYGEIDVRAIQPSTLEYRFTYTETIDRSAAAEYFTTMIPTLQSVVNSAVGPSMVAAGVKSPKVRYTYLNPDGSTLWTHTFKPA